MTDTTQDPAPPGNADLDAIEAEAAALEGAAQAAAQPAPQPTNTADELDGALRMLRLMVKPAFADWPDFDQAWGDQTIHGIATSGAAIMDRHGWTMGAFFEQWGPYIGLVAATAPPAIATMQHLKLRKLREAERQRQQGASGERPQQAAN